MKTVLIRNMMCTLLALWTLFPGQVLAQLPLPQAQPNLDLRGAASGGVTLALPDGGAIVAHDGLFAGGNVIKPRLFRMRADGSVDSPWSVQIDNSVLGLALAGDDLYLAGSFTTVNGVSRRGLARVSLTSGALSDWNPNQGSTTTYRFLTVAIVDDALYVGGEFTQLGAEARSHLAKVNRLTGGLDTVFQPAIVGTFNPVATLHSDGTSLFVGGRISSVNGIARGNAAKFSLASGALDTDWAPVFSSSVERLRSDAGFLYAVGCFSQVNGVQRLFAARVSSVGAGSVDLTWNPAPNGGCVNALHIDATHAYVSGPFTALGGQPASRIGRVTKAGAATLDATWGPMLDSGASYVVGLPNGSVLITGTFVDVNGIYQPGVVRVSGLNGATTNPALFSEQGAVVKALVGAPDGGVYVGGFFHRVAGAGVLRRGVLRLTPSGALDTNWVAALSGRGDVGSLASDANHLYVGGSFVISGATPTNNLARVSHIGAIDTTWTPNASGPVYTLVIDAVSNTVLIGGGFTSISGQPRSRMAELNRTTGQLTPFNPQLNGAVRSLAIDGSSVFAGGEFTLVGGTTRQHLAKLGRDGSMDVSFTADANSSVFKLLLGPGGTIYAGGLFTSISGLGRTGLARLLRSSGTPDPTWNTFPNSSVFGLNPASDGFYIGGDFSEIGGTSRDRVARVSHQGVVAPLFAPAGVPAGVSPTRIEAALEQGSRVTLAGWVNWFETTIGVRRGLAAFPTNAMPVTPTLTITSALPGNTQPHQFYRVEVNAMASGAPLAFQRITVDCDSGSFCEMQLDSQGNGACEIASRSPGDRTLTARYVGSTFFQPAVATRTHRVAGIAATPPANPSFDLRSPASVPILLRNSDGSLVITGNFNRIGSEARRGLARLLTDGSADLSFRADLNSAGTIGAMARDSTDNLFVVGSFSHVNGVFRPRLAKLDPNGNVVASWVPAQTAISTDTAYVDHAGDLIIRGTSLGTGSPVVWRSSLLKFAGATGEQRFDLDVVVARTSTPPTFRVIGDGMHLYVFGAFDSVNGVARRNLARLSPSGVVDPSWDPSPNQLVRAVISDGIGGVYVGGEFTEIAEQGTQTRLVRLVGSGALDSSFNAAPDNLVDYLVRDGTSLYVGGFFSSIGGLSRSVQAKIDASTGVGDPSFLQGAPVGTRFERLGDSLWTAISAFEMTLTDVRWMGAVRKDLATGEALPTPAVTRPAQVYALARQPDGATLIGGLFARFGSIQRNLVRITPTGVYDTTFSPTLAETAAVRALAVRGNGDIYVGDARGLRKLNAVGFIDSGFASPNSSVLALADGGDGLIAGGTFSLVGSPMVNRARIAKLDYATGAAIGAWNPGSDGTVESLAIGPDGSLYLGGNFFTVGGLPRQRLAKLNPDGSINGAWQPIATSAVRALLIDGSNVYAGGSFSTINGIARRGVAKFAVSDGTLANWAPGGTTTFPNVYALARAQDGGVLIGGSFRTMGGSYRSNAAKVDPETGLAEPLWNPSLDGPVFAILSGYGNTPARFRAASVEQSIAIGGDFEFQGDEPMPGFVAVPSIGQPTTLGVFCDGFESVACVPRP